MNLRSFSLFVFALCFLFPSVGFSMDDDSMDDKTDRLLRAYGKDKRVFIEDLVEHVDPGTKIYLVVNDQSYGIGTSVESMKALFALGECKFNDKPLVNFSDHDLVNFAPNTTFRNIDIWTTAEKLKILCDNRDPIRKAISSLELLKPHENLENYVNALKDLRG